MVVCFNEVNILYEIVELFYSSSSAIFYFFFCACLYLNNVLKKNLMCDCV